MTRGGFLKSLLMLAVAPKVISQIEFESTKQAVIKSSASFITDLNLLTPLWYEKMIQKYGTDNYKLAMEILGNNSVQQVVTNETFFILKINKKE